MSKRIVAVLMSMAVVLTTVASGCGESDSEAGSQTKAEFIKQGSAICERTLRRIAVELKADQRAGGGTQSDDLIKDVMLPNFRSQVEELGSLTAPSGDEERVETILGTLEKGIEEAEKAPPGSAISSDSRIVKGKLMAEEYGLEGCARFF